MAAKTLSHSNGYSKRQAKLLRFGNQLTLTANLLKAHPLTSDRLTIIQTTLEYVNLQIRWTSAGPLARLLMSMQAALLGSELSTSKVGFVGAALEQMQQATALLMKTALKSTAAGAIDFLITFNQILTYGLIYLTTQTLGQWKEYFPQQNLSTVRKGGQFFRELSLLFLLRSEAIETAFRLVTQELGLDSKNQKLISDIGLFQILMIILIVAEEEHQQDIELIDSLNRFLAPTLDSIEYAIQNLHEQNKLSDALFFTANRQLQVLRFALDNPEKESFQQTIETGFQALGLSYQEVKNDLKRLVLVCKQINMSLKNIFNQTETTITTVNQAA